MSISILIALQEIGGLAVHWRLFGSSGHLKHPNRPVMQVKLRKHTLFVGGSERHVHLFFAVHCALGASPPCRLLHAMQAPKGVGAQTGATAGSGISRLLLSPIATRSLVRPEKHLRAAFKNCAPEKGGFDGSVSNMFLVLAETHPAGCNPRRRSGTARRRTAGTTASLKCWQTRTMLINPTGRASAPSCLQRYLERPHAHVSFAFAVWCAAIVWVIRTCRTVGLAAEAVTHHLLPQAQLQVQQLQVCRQRALPANTRLPEATAVHGEDRHPPLPDQEPGGALCLRRRSVNTITQRTTFKDASLCLEICVIPDIESCCGSLPGQVSH